MRRWSVRDPGSGPLREDLRGLLGVAAAPIRGSWAVNKPRSILLGIKNLRAASVYGFLAAVIVGAVQLFFSWNQGGYFAEQWHQGAQIILVALGIAILVPGYFWAGPLGIKQWILAGALVSFAGVVVASISWSISREASVEEAARTAMYAGAFLLLLPAASRWGALMADATIFGALLPPAVYGLLQKVYPTLMPYTGLATLESDPRASSTFGYHPIFGAMCAMGALLVLSRVGSFRSIPVRAFYTATGVLFLVALYFSFSRGGLLALAGGVVVLLVLSRRRRFEVLGNAIIVGLAALWVVSQAQQLPGLVARPVARQAMQIDGWLLVGILAKAVLAAFAAQVAFSLLIRLVERFVPAGVRRAAGVLGTLAVVGVVVFASHWGWSTLQSAGGIDEMKAQFTGESEGYAPAYVWDSDRLNQDLTQRYASLYGANRLELWSVAWENWRQHPLTGTGGDTYPMVYEREKAADSPGVSHPHSLWLNLLSDVGLAGFLTFATFCAGLLGLAAYNACSAARGRRSRAVIAGSAAAATAYLISASVDWNWYLPASTLPFFALAAVAAGTKPATTRRAREAAPSPVEPPDSEPSPPRERHDDVLAARDEP